MYQSLIKQYIDKLDKKTVNDFLIKNEIKLNSQELGYLYNIIKNKYQDFFDNEDIILNDLKNNMRLVNYQKILSLFLNYKKKYKNYL